MKKIFSTILMLQLLTIPSMIYAQNCVLTVSVTGFEEIEGKVSIGLFSGPENFPRKSNNRLGAVLDLKDSTVVYTFSELKSGEYAIAIYHDENGNGELDRNFLGMPSEDYVFSNYATGSFGPPSFENAKFYLKDSLEIKLDLNQ